MVRTNWADRDFSGVLLMGSSLPPVHPPLNGGTNQIMLEHFEHEYGHIAMKNMYMWKISE
jgi:hypothetical protein